MQLLTDTHIPDMHLETYTDTAYPSYKLSFKNAPAPSITITAYGHMAELARQAALELAYQHEIFTEIIVPTQLSPFNNDPVISSTRTTNKLLTVEEGGQTLGWGAEVIALVKEALGSELIMARRVAASDSPIPAAMDLEDQVLPNTADIVQTALKMV